MASTARDRKRKIGKVTGVETETAENGFIIVARDTNYENKKYIASTEQEAVSIATVLLSGKKPGKSVLEGGE